MRALNFILAIIYPILIILLLLSNKSCQDSNTAEQQNQESVSEQQEETQTPVDTANVVRRAQKTGKSGNLKVTLLWAFEGDIDLHVKQPNGREIYYKKKKDSSSGGFLDVDNVNGGINSAENIYWENPQKGVYDITLHYYQPSRRTKRAESGICTVVVFQDGKSPQKYEVEMTTVKEKKSVAKIVLQ